MGNGQAKPSALINAAKALEEELSHFRGLAGRLAIHRLDSGAGVASANRMLASAGEIEAKIGQQVAALSAAINELHRLQQECVTAINERAAVIRERAATYQALMERYQSLGESARELNGKMRPALEGGSVNIAEIMIEARKGAQGLVVQVEALAQQSRDSQFSDIERLSSELRQQLRGALGKLS
jgi:hypothetical protein